jgi:hypothetical protein
MAHSSAQRLTRVVVDEQATLEVAQIQTVMYRIQSALRKIPHAEREYIANALLNLAVSELVREEGEDGAATILMRLGDVLVNCEVAPPPSRAIDLSGRDS